MDLSCVVSADSHVNEPEAAFARIPKDLRERFGPHFVQDPPGKKGLHIVFKGHRPDPVGNTFLAGTGRDPKVVKDRVENFTWDRWRGPWDPSARLGDMDLDGVTVEVLYPSMARSFYGLFGDETPLQLAGLKSYNDWMLEYCAVAPKRLVPLCLLSVLDIPWSVEEMQRCAKLGHKGASLPSILPEGTTYMDPAFEPIWAAAEDLDLPIQFHNGIQQGADRDVYLRREPRMRDVGERVIATAVMESTELLKDLLFGLVLERHPRMRVMFAEYEITWILAFFHYRVDPNAHRFALARPDVPHFSVPPTEIVRRQVYVTFQEDPAGVAGAAALDFLDNCMWASDYPHGSATWPNSRAIIRSQLEGFDDATVRKLVWENAVDFYGVA
jgi:predicted TIM-barrel fold metal-dependent hydrolase